MNPYEKILEEYLQFAKDFAEKVEKLMKKKDLNRYKITTRWITSPSNEQLNIFVQGLVIAENEQEARKIAEKSPYFKNQDFIVTKINNE